MTPSRASGRVFHGLPERSFKDPEAGGGKPVVQSAEWVRKKGTPLGQLCTKMLWTDEVIHAKKVPPQMGFSAKKVPPTTPFQRQKGTPSQ